MLQQQKRPDGGGPSASVTCAVIGMVAMSDPRAKVMTRSYADILASARAPRPRSAAMSAT
jgi:hypothetical protein